MTHFIRSALLGALLCALSATHAAAESDDAFRELFESLVEIDTTYATGDCTAAADAAAAAMLARGFPATAIHRYVDPRHPKEGGLVAMLEGRNPDADAVLLVAHIDVVDAERADWKHDPFKLTEENGYFFGRGVADNKAVAAALIDLLVRLRAEGFRPRRTIKVALTCGEETPAAFNGAAYLATQRRDLVDAGLVLVPSGGAMTDGAGRVRSLALQAGEKTQQNFRLEATGAARHASRPGPDNAIYSLAAALTRLESHRFPSALNDTTRRYFRQVAMAAASTDAAAIRALLADEKNLAAEAIVSANTEWNAMLRTTCVATVVNAGAQLNTVQPRAAANINCRLLPGDDGESVRRALADVIDDPAITITAVPPIAVATLSPPLTPALLDPLTAVAGKTWPGAAIVATMLTGATDARHFNAVGMPAYGITVLFYDADGNGVHGVNERVSTRSVREGRLFLERLVRRYAMAD